MKQCLFCAEDIQPAAVVCRYCSGNQAAVIARGMRQEMSSKAVFSLVASILWVFGIGSVLAVIYGHLAQKEIDETGGAMAGRALATWGTVLGWIGIGFLALGVLAATYSLAFQIFRQIVSG